MNELRIAVAGAGLIGRRHVEMIDRLHARERSARLSVQPFFQSLSQF